MSTLLSSVPFSLGHRLAGSRTAALLRLLGLALAARRQRHSLAHLDDATLRDIGITRSQAMAEAQRKAWDVPQSWLR